MTQVAETGPSRTDTPAPGRISHHIGGRLVAGTSGREGAVYDPATGRYSLDVLGAVRGARLATTLALLVGFLLLRAREHYWRGPRA